MVISLIRDKGIILAKQRIKEKDLLFRILSYRNGLMTLLAFSGATSRRRIGGKGEKFSTVFFSAKTYQEYISLEELNLINSHEAILQSFQKIVQAETIVEILLASLPENTPAPEIFRLFDQYLDALSTDAPIPMNQILYNLMKAEGFIKDPHHCQRCGRELIEAYFSPTEGFLCRKCHHTGNRRSIFFSHEELKALTAKSPVEDRKLRDKLLDIWEEILEKRLFSRKML